MINSINIQKQIATYIHEFKQNYANPIFFILVNSNRATETG